MGRGCITYSILFLAGITASGHIPHGFLLTVPITLLSLAISIISRRNKYLFLLFTHIAIFFIGTGANKTGIYSKNDSNYHTINLVSNIGEHMQEIASKYLKQFSNSNTNHSVLCALAIGKRDLMDKSLAKSYKIAGGMHILALSGLHVGIIYSILELLIFPLMVLPYSRWLKFIISSVFILFYCLLSGCSPSVLRAGTMILIYKGASLSYRQVGKWDAIALSALLIGAVSPEQVLEIGFQLSYTAVAGIALLFPVCRRAFLQIIPQWGGIMKPAYKVALKLWESLSVSVCCQIALLPLLLLYFGTSAQYFLITNIVAIPLASAILHILIAVIFMHNIPIAGEFLTNILNILIEFLNWSMAYISN